MSCVEVGTRFANPLPLSSSRVVSDCPPLPPISSTSIALPCSGRAAVSAIDESLRACCGHPNDRCGFSFFISSIAVISHVVIKNSRLLMNIYIDPSRENSTHLLSRGQPKPLASMVLAGLVLRLCGGRLGKGKQYVDKPSA